MMKGTKLDGLFSAKVDNSDFPKENQRVTGHDVDNNTNNHNNGNGMIMKESVKTCVSAEETCSSSESSSSSMDDDLYHNNGSSYHNHHNRLIPSSLAAADEDDDEEEEDAPTIYYLKREYRVHASVLQTMDSFSSLSLSRSSSHRCPPSTTNTTTTTMGLCESEHISDRWSRLANNDNDSYQEMTPLTTHNNTNTNTKTGTRQRRATTTAALNHSTSSNRKMLTQSEHYGSSRRASYSTPATKTTTKSTAPAPAPTASGRRSMSASYSQSSTRGRYLPKRTSNSTATGTTTTNSLGSQSEHYYNHDGLLSLSSTASAHERRRSSACATRKPAPFNNHGMSRSEHISSTRTTPATRRATTTALPVTRRGSASSGLDLCYTSEHTGLTRPGRRASVAATEYISRVGKYVQTSLSSSSSSSSSHPDDVLSRRAQKWSITGEDVWEIIDDPQVFAKLQRDLRARKAVTNTTIQQRLHVFVHNTKERKRHSQIIEWEQQLQRESAHDELERQSSSRHGKSTEKEHQKCKDAENLPELKKCHDSSTNIMSSSDEPDDEEEDEDSELIQ